MVNGYIFMFFMKGDNFCDIRFAFLVIKGALVAQWVKHWPTDLADRVRSSLEVKSSHP